MSNLGLYQWITTISKKVGGVKNLLAIIVGASATAGSAITLAVQHLLNRNKKSRLIAMPEMPSYVVDTSYSDKSGFTVQSGDDIKIVAVDDPTVLVIINEDETVYAIDKKTLQKISNYKI